MKKTKISLLFLTLSICCSLLLCFNSEIIAAPDGGKCRVPAKRHASFDYTDCTTPGSSACVIWCDTL